jgi:hypothetical protein
LGNRSVLHCVENECKDRLIVDMLILQDPPHPGLSIAAAAEGRAGQTYKLDALPLSPVGERGQGEGVVAV